MNIIWGCKPSGYYAQLKFDDNCWPVTDTLTFSYNREGRGNTTLNIELRMLPDYEYMNIHLKLLLEPPTGETMTFMLNDTLIDPLGNWLVEPSFWGSYQISLKPVTLPDSVAGTYSCKLLHYMRQEKLCRISGVGVHIH